VCSAVPDDLIRFDYGCGSRGVSSVISRLGGCIDGLIFSGALCDGGRRVGELATYPSCVFFIRSVFLSPLVLVILLHFSHDRS
jgi:hypothetical protein